MRVRFSEREFEALDKGVGDRTGVPRRCRWVRRPARSPARARAPAESRSRQDFGPGAGRAISHLHRGGAQRPARACRRLSRDGGLARLSEVAAAAAAAARGRRAAARRISRPRWRSACSGSKPSAPRRKRWSTGPRLGRDMFLRGSRKASRSSRRRYGRRACYDLLAAYAQPAPEAGAVARCTLHQRFVWSLAEARDALNASPAWRSNGRCSTIICWTIASTPELARTVRASAFSASLEMVREGHLDLRQDRAFAPLWVKRRQAEPPDASPLMSGVDTGRSAARVLRHWSKALKPQLNWSERDRAEAGPVGEAMRIAEALLFAAAEPLEESEIARPPARRRRCRRDSGAAAARIMPRRGVNLVRVGKKWLFRTAADLGWLLSREETQPQQAFARRVRDAGDRRLSPAGHARRDRGHPRRRHLQGHARRAARDRLGAAARRRRTPGRPSPTARRSLPVHFGLEAIADLPGLEELKGAGLFEGRLPRASACRCPTTIRR